MASCSGDKTIKIWRSNPPFNIINSLEEHTDCVVSIIQLYEKEIFISYSLDGTLCIWNLTTYQCNAKINEVSCFSKSVLVEMNDGSLALAGNNEIQIVNIEEKAIEKKIPFGEKEQINSLVKLRDGNLLLGLMEGHLSLYDINDNKIILIKDKAHTKNISCMININGHQFISCSEANMKIWSY